MAAVTLVRTLTGLAPADDAAAAVIKRWNLGEHVRADIRKPRAHRSLRRWWALCNLVYQNSEQFASPELVHQFLKIRAGHAIEIVSKATGEVYLLADSINYERLSEDEFMDVWNRAVKVVAEDILGTGVPEIEAEIARCIGLAA